VHRLEQAAKQGCRLDPEIVMLPDGGERAACIAGEKEAEQPPDRAAVRQAEHVADLRGGDAVLAMGDRLVEDRQAVARGAFGGTGDQRQRFRFGLDALGLAHPGEMPAELLGGDAAQVEPLTARQYGDRDLVHLGRREQEFHVRRRLFQRLQKRVERVLGQHVDFIDDVDLVAGRHRRIAHRLDDLADVVDAVLLAASISTTSM
jgi:hypothetical protein